MEYRKPAEGSTCSPDAVGDRGWVLRVTNALVRTCCFQPITSVGRGMCMATGAMLVNDGVPWGWWMIGLLEYMY